MEIKGNIIINYQSDKSIREAEQKYFKFCNMGYILYETIQISTEKFKFTFI